MKRSRFQPKIGGFRVAGDACPSGAVTMHHFTYGQILAQVEALLN